MSIICLTRAGTGLGGLAATSAASVHLALGLGVGAGVLDGGSIAVVGVDANEEAAVLGSNTLHIHVTLALRLALLNGVSWDLIGEGEETLTLPQDR